MTSLVVQAAALTLILVRGSIFAPLRSRGPAIWRELASCALCAGFWVGLAWFLVAIWPVAGRAAVAWCVGGAATTAVAALLLTCALDVLAALASWLEKRSE